MKARHALLAASLVVLLCPPAPPAGAETPAAAPPAPPAPPASVRPVAGKSAELRPNTPEPLRFVARDTRLVDRAAPDRPLFLKGVGYSPFLAGETPLKGAAPGNDGRYERDLALMRDMGVNYLHVFPRRMPENFFKALDENDLIYGQDIWITPYDPDYLDPAYQARELAIIKEVIDHNYKAGRPDRLVLFSIGDELRPASVAFTNAAHPDVTDFEGEHVVVRGRTATEVAVARLMDAAMDYELTRYGRRHLYCHTSYTHLGPITDRPDLEVAAKDALLPDMGDLLCLNIYTYANAVRTSGPGSVTGRPFQGYLEQLARDAAKPILIGQTGHSTSPVMPNPDVPGFGGHSPEAAAEKLTRTWEDFRTAQGRERFCGLALFEWQDEWWKSGETPDDPAAQAPEDPEEWFGLFALGPDNTLVPKTPLPETVKRLYKEALERPEAPDTPDKAGP